MAAFSDLSVKPQPRDCPALSVPTVPDTGLPLTKPGCQAKLRKKSQTSEKTIPPADYSLTKCLARKLLMDFGKLWLNRWRIWSRFGCADRHTTSSDRSSRMVVAPASLQHCCCCPGAAFSTRVTSWEGPSLGFFAQRHHLLLGTCCVPTQGWSLAAEEASGLPFPCWEEWKTHDGAGGQVLHWEEPLESG